MTNSPTDSKVVYLNQELFHDLDQFCIQWFN